MNPIDMDRDIVCQNAKTSAVRCYEFNLSFAKTARSYCTNVIINKNADS